jgi:DNA-directed RNA polymerase specialized sigma24 family protein
MRQGVNAVDRRPGFSSRRANGSGQEFATGVDAIYRYFWSQVGNREDAEDLTAQVIRSAGNLLPNVTPDGDMPDALRTACRRSLDAYHGRHGENGSRRTRTGNRPPPPVRVASTDILAALTTRHRDVLELCLVRGYPQEDAAAELGISIDALRSLLRQALACAAEAQRI